MIIARILVVIDAKECVSTKAKFVPKIRVQKRTWIAECSSSKRRA